MRKLSLRTELIMPLNGALASETDAVVGGTGPLYTQLCNTPQYTPGLHYTPQRLDNIRKGINNLITRGCPGPRPGGPFGPTGPSGMSVCRAC
jgi:hypothetical protein